jgi:YafQ family addiction module toxin component
MREFEIHPDLDKQLKKLSTKGRVQFEQIFEKIDEIINCTNLNHYKNLRAPLQKYKRIHIGKSYVLLFSVKDDKVLFRYYEHHDVVYK